MQNGENEEKTDTHTLITIISYLSSIDNQYEIQ